MQTEDSSSSKSIDASMVELWNAAQQQIHAAVLADDSLSGFQLPPSTSPAHEIVIHKSQVHPTSSHSSSSSTLPPLHLIGGADVSFFKEDDSRGIACVVVLEFPSFKLVYHHVRDFSLAIPYIPGYLAFREKDIILSMLNELKTNQPNLYPQILFVDGNGLHHPRGAGSACHIGVEGSLPTIGIAKTFLAMPGLMWNEHDYKTVLQKKGDWVRLIRMPDEAKEGESEDLSQNSVTACDDIVGASLRPTDDSLRPIFVSVGHRISLETAVQLTVDCCRYRYPEPLRAADWIGREYIRQLQGAASGKPYKPQEWSSTH